MARPVLLPIAFVQPLARALTAHDAGYAAPAGGSPSEPDTPELSAGNRERASR
jgi:hypothetical protein